MPSPEEDVLTGLRDLLTPLATGPGTLFQLSDTPDVQWALNLTRGPTDTDGRWGQAVLTLMTRGPRSQPLAVHGQASPVVDTIRAVSGETLGTTTVNTVEHRGASAGPDGNKRTTRVDTFFLDLDYQA